MKYYDSLRRGNPHFGPMIKRFLADEHRHVLKKVKSFDNYKVIFVQQLPMQDNLYDCGVFAVKYLEWVSDGISPGGPGGFKRDDISYFRWRMALEIIQGRLLDSL